MNTQELTKGVRIDFRPLPGVTVTPSMDAAPYCTGAPHLGWVLYSRGGGGCWNQRTEREFAPEPSARPVFRDGAWYWVAP